MATVTITDDRGNVMLVIGVDNTEAGQGGLPHGDVCYDGNELDRGAAWCAAAGLTQVHFTKQVLDSLRQVRALELEDEESNDLVLDHDEGHCQKLGDHEQRLAHLEAHLPQQGGQPPAKRTENTEQAEPALSHTPACFRQDGEMWLQHGKDCTLVSEHGGISQTEC